MRYKLSIPVTGFLITLTILVITAFQVYWLRKNYREEEKLFATRTNVLFRETIFRLQAAKLKMDSGMSIPVQDREGVISISNVLQEKLRDSSTTKPRIKQAMFITMKAPHLSDSDSLEVHYRASNGAPGKTVFDFLAGVDSLRDSITVKEIVDRYHKALNREKINLPFSINTFPADTTEKNYGPFPDNLEGNIVTIGFTKPVSYQVLFENNTWYLLKRIGQPILISFLLLSVTILSFLLLYRNLKQQQKLAQIKNDFISNMTHELKTPIATVSVAIEALKSFNVLEDPQRTEEYLDISAHEMQRLGLLVDKVLKLSMFENREIALNKEQFDLVELAKSVMVSMKLQFEKQQAVTALETTGKNFIITADKLHLTSVLYNLLDNALKYSIKDPEILIHIIDHTQYLEIRVTDNGVGIAKEYKSKIFEKFFRVPSGNRHNIKGYGLGLSYVSHIVQRHMGFIEVESELDKGSTFSVKLPFVEAPVIYYDRGRMIAKHKII
ncbi:two-component system, OmpR family, phosphate regulon sensor histidine kinase PhoR [Chitinophaga sp. CF118]|uniref:sensor histidine kinase n=1 Tax=Chitinophaga sp. CF118 TaxID=1884367 RepID=UPI0008DF4400|nr:HAMP domain-containing sensor histidine kinase [Chitinophaga sp. CF118]SFF02519.1 two-component system, OmpR family, phosphate regulon sensor histidine kinase PhoR [Chitinophaga sp. CF118]